MTEPPAQPKDDAEPEARHAEFTQLYDEEHTRLLRIAAMMAPNLDGEGAAHDAFVRLWRRWDTVHTSKRAWLVRTMCNLIIDQARSLERPGELTDELTGWQRGTYRVLVQRQRDPEHWQELSDTLRAIGKLPEQLRTALVLRFWEISDDETAEVLGCDRATVRKYVSTARARVAEVVGNPERRFAARPGRRGRGNDHDR
ncbi:RNA polymerase sigma factor [Solihabitans fulvus]|uniref:RNA polymerase sigma factor n=1 Tax=Solihabitans fulvus TaxID=1892852 RepID=UPI001661C3F8|nr:sigma-70 family RNA polymerase sigma factor [Solihabitans fulvus]